MEYLEKMNLYMIESYDGILDIFNDPCYSQVFKQELRAFLEGKDDIFSFIGNVRDSDPTVQGALLIKSEADKDGDEIIYIESVAKPSDIYYQLNKYREDFGNCFKPYLKFIKINFT